MLPELAAVLQLEVPVIVRLGERQMSISEVLQLVPGSIIELPKLADAELDLMVNNKQIAVGQAVKLGENFGLQITFVGDLRTRIEALGGEAAQDATGAPKDEDVEAMAAAMLSGQGV
jgi:flagellar motor switch protein FliN